MKRLAHDTPFIGSPVTLGDFWAWAYSDLLDNTLRGALAEYIVATALGVNEGVRVNWDPYDLAYRGLKKTLSLSALKKLCPSPVPFSSLKESLDALVASS